MPLRCLANTGSKKASHGLYHGGGRGGEAFPQSWSRDEPEIPNTWKCHTAGLLCLEFLQFSDFLIPYHTESSS